MQIVVMNKSKTSPAVYVLRVVLALTFMLKAVYTVQTQFVSYLDGTAIPYALGVSMASIMYGLIAFALFWLVSSTVYGNISLSRYFPINDLGQCAVSKNEYSIILYAVAIANNAVMGGLNAMLYAVPVATSFVSLVAVRLISIVSVLIFDAILASRCAKGAMKEFVVAMAIPSFFLVIVMGV